MNAFVVSTITLIMELIIGTLIFWIIYRGYTKSDFSKNITFFAIFYEVIFNVGYMIYRSVAVPSVIHLSDMMKKIAMTHGILSLVMLVCVVIYFLRAYKEYGQGINSFFIHKIQTLLFILFWSISLLSGIFLYINIYF